jgi:hypothetical protein
MRLYRKRRRQGLRYVRIPLHVMEIEDLIRMWLLTEDQRYDAEAIQAAALNLVHQAPDDARAIWLPTRTRLQVRHRRPVARAAVRHNAGGNANGGVNRVGAGR